MIDNKSTKSRKIQPPNQRQKDQESNIQSGKTNRIRNPTKPDVIQIQRKTQKDWYPLTDK
ncbi:hypothetical protein OI18_07570 [Flavihumibacter solisilvae]|uniref:Uncharacterized protein n=1 Tax=Flavihumibacter solisilvae TaxID=1349421 RepID=A0A0C1L4X6_9BACT|nr:hypothetical protein OI18_07570 [Flavihumibacter solisilvae]